MLQLCYATIASAIHVRLNFRFCGAVVEMTTWKKTWCSKREARKGVENDRGLSGFLCTPRDTPRILRIVQPLYETFDERLVLVASCGLLLLLLKLYNLTYLTAYCKYQRHKREKFYTSTVFTCFIYFKYIEDIVSGKKVARPKDISQNFMIWI